MSVSKDHCRRTESDKPGVGLRRVLFELVGSMGAVVAVLAYLSFGLVADQDSGTGQADLVSTHNLAEPQKVDENGADLSAAGYVINTAGGNPPGNAGYRVSDNARAASRLNFASSKQREDQVVLTGGAGTDKPAKAKKDDDLSMPEWQKIIHPDGTAVDLVGRNGHGGTDGVSDYLQLYPAYEAGYIDEVISNGVATDMSALLVATDVAEEVLYNGAVSAAHDLGNAFYLLTVAPTGSLRFYFGVERLRSDLPTFIEFELNQNPLRVASGIPWWNIQGSRTDGDVLVRFNLIAGTLTSVELAEWRNGGYFIFESDTQGLGQGCRDRFSFMYCVGPPPLDRSRQNIEVWDENFVPVTATLADSFIELGLDINRLLGSANEFNGVYIRTPEDVALSSFRGLGGLAGSSHGSP